MRKGIIALYSYDLNDLLERCIEDGFTVESLSKATDIPVELINRYRSNGELTLEDIQTLEYLLFFLLQLYFVNPESDTYLKDMVETLNSYFKIPTPAIAKYLNLEENVLNIFLQRPDSLSSGDNITKKLAHLFTTFVRDKRHST